MAQLVAQKGNMNGAKFALHLESRATPAWNWPRLTCKLTTGHQIVSEAWMDEVTHWSDQDQACLWVKGKHANSSLLVEQGMLGVGYKGFFWHRKCTRNLHIGSLLRETFGVMSRRCAYQALLLVGLWVNFDRMLLTADKTDGSQPVFSGHNGQVSGPRHRVALVDFDIISHRSSHDVMMLLWPLDGQMIIVDLPSETTLTMTGVSEEGPWLVELMAIMQAAINHRS